MRHTHITHFSPFLPSSSPRHRPLRSLHYYHPPGVVISSRHSFMLPWYLKSTFTTRTYFFLYHAFCNAQGTAENLSRTERRKKRKGKKKGVGGGGCEKNKATLTILIGSRAGFSTVSWDGLVFLPVVLLGFCPLP